MCIYFTGALGGFNRLGINECRNSYDSTHGVYLINVFLFFIFLKQFKFNNKSFINVEGLEEQGQCGS